MASEYGWTIKEIKNLHRSEILELGEEITKRKTTEIYLQRRNFAELTIHIFGMLGGKEEKKIEDLIGPPPYYGQESAGGIKTAPEDTNQGENKKVLEWKENALNLGLKIGGE